MSSLCWPFCATTEPFCALRHSPDQSCPHQLPLVSLDTSLSFLGAFPCACMLSLVSASLLTLSFSPSMLSFRRKVDVRCVLHILTVIINDLNDQSLSAAHLRAGWMEQGWEEMVSRWFSGWLHLSSLSDQNRAGSPFPCWGNVPSRAVSAPGSSESSPCLVHVWLPSALSFQLALHSPLPFAFFF